MGSNFIHYILNNFNNTKVFNLDLLTYAGNKDNLIGIPAKRYKFLRGDICDTALAARIMKKVDFVVNFAAETHVDRSIYSESEDFMHSNIIGVYSLMKALRLSPNVKKMVQISTDEVWGDLPLKSKSKFNENSPIKPNSPYSASKAAGELLVRAYVKTYNLRVIISRSVNNFGPRQFPEKLIPFFTLRAMKDQLLPLYGDGQNIRDWLYVDDHTEAILKLLHKGVIGEIYGISRSKECSNIEIAKKILKLLGKPEKLITFVEDRLGHDRRYSVDSSKLRRLGWKPAHSFNEQFSYTINWYRKNQQWLNNLLKKRSNINIHINLKK